MKNIVLTIACFSLLLAAGCGTSNDEVIATVGNNTITLAQVKDFDVLYPVAFQSADEEFEAKKEFVDSLIKTRLLVIGAYQNDLDIDKEVMDIVETQKPKFLLDELFKKEIMPKSKVTEAEIKAFYDKMKEQVHLSHILVDNEKLADSLYEAIKDGADYDQIARDYSLDQETARLGGDLGYARWGRFLDSFQEEAWRLSPKQISRPFVTEMGWHIVRMNERFESDPGPYEVMAPRIRAMIQTSKRQKAMNEYLDALEEKYEVNLNDDTYESVLARINHVYPDTLGGKYFRKTMIDQNLLEDHQRSMVLATFEGGELTVKEYFDALANVPDPNRPEFKDKDLVKSTIFSLNLENFLTLEAKADGLEDSESYARVMKSFTESVMADRMSSLITESTPEITNDEYYDYYQANTDQFTTPERVKVSEIQVDSFAVAESLRVLIDKGADFATLAKNNTVRPGKNLTDGDLGYFEAKQHPDIFSLARTMKQGEIKGPVEMNEKWSIIKKTGYESPKLKPIEEVAEDIDAILKAQKRQEKLSSWLESKRAETSIEVDYDLIWKTIDEDKYNKDDNA